MLRLSALARAHGAKFVAAEARGLFCRVFCDFGPSFRVDDATGETPVAAAVAAISAASPGEVTVQEERRHELQDGDAVVFSEVAGMPALNGAAPLPVKVTGPFSFTIGDTSGACVPCAQAGRQAGRRTAGSECRESRLSRGPLNVTSPRSDPSPSSRSPHSASPTCPCRRLPRLPLPLQRWAATCRDRAGSRR